jgi:hypothetical protein
MRVEWTDLLFGVFITFMFFALIVCPILKSWDETKYNTCRKYDQPIERCIKELGWK